MRSAVRDNFMRVMVVAALALGAAVHPGAALADGDGPSKEYLVKAAFVRNFAQFTTWPDKAFADGSSELVIAVVGSSPFKGALTNAVKGKKAEGHPIVVKHFASVDEVGDCHVLFVASDVKLADVRAKLGNKAVLTVGDTDEFTARGGMIRLYLEHDTVRFEINVQAAENAKLKLNSRLLQLARIYKG